MTLLAVAKAIGPPGSINCLALGCIVGLFFCYVWPRSKRLGRAWLFGLYSTYIILAVPVVAQMITGPLGTFRPVEDLSRIGPVEVLFVFDGDNGDARVLEAQRIWRASSPRVVIVSGQDWLLEKVEAAGIPSNRILCDSRSVTTADQIEYVSHYMAQHAGVHAFIIASRLQMTRIAALVKAANIHVGLLPSPVNVEPRFDGLLRWVPTYSALRVSRDAMYERVAIAYYARRGWDAATAPASTSTAWR